MKNYKSKKCVTFRLLLLMAAISATAQAQDLLPEVNVAPNPLDEIKSSFYPVPKKPVKRIIYIAAGDTTSVSSFDPDGSECLRIGYSKNKPVNKLVCQKSDSGTEALFYGNFQQDLQATSKYKYDKNRNLTEWEKTGYSAIHWFFEYDSKNRLSRKYTIGEIAANQKARIQDYTYDTAGRLIEIVREQWVKKFTYDGDRLIDQKELYINGDINTLNSFSRYSYNAAGHLTKKVSDLDSVLYFYEGANLRSMVSYKKDATYEAVDFFYEKNLLSKATINTNSIYSGVFFLFPRLPDPPAQGQISKREMHFFYDSHNNIKEIKYFIEGKYKYNKEFIAQYY